MKRALVLFFGCLLIVGCDNKKPEADLPAPFLVGKIEQFINDHGDWEQNDIIKERTNTVFMDSVLAWSKDSLFLSKVPIRIGTLKEIKEKNKVHMVAIGNAKYRQKDNSVNHLKLAGYSNKQRGIFNRMNLTLGLFIEPELVDTIVSGEEYYVFGKVFRLTDPPSGLVAGDYYLGTYFIDVDSISGVSGN